MSSPLRGANGDLGGKAKLATALEDLRGDGFHDMPRPMAKQQGTVGHIEVDVFPAFDVPQAATFSALRDQRQVIGEDAHGAAVPTGDGAFCARHHGLVAVL